MDRMYYVCRSCVGRHIWVRTHSGKMYKGKATRVTSEHLYLQSAGYGVAGEEITQEKIQNAVYSKKEEMAEEVFFGLIALPLLGIGAVGFLGGAIGGFFGGFLGARAGRSIGPGYGRYY